ncbi:acylphosphatase (plasmid) [Methylosinus trichosporium OB3b]|uniref:acylphosphatase n=1 Tax=Methylosinus trichosporium (strain ATCC 35070 / NCIMB 11131 / UNIQEM 75 / OB3b) TaxID=595536 RepID=A0A2D2D6M2_METT3|nr:acylphosphatase [Methylosinus trichosporium OB3b]OBS52835.1 acylphosphatase [Methylosinus sp. 3S-1]
MNAWTRVARIIVAGRVQNVGYRVFVAREAGRLHLFGWVRNRSDGSVETVVAGPKSMVAEFLALAARGPATAQIDAVRIEDAGAHAVSEGGGEHGFVAAPAI